MKTILCVLMFLPMMAFLGIGAALAVVGKVVVEFGVGVLWLSSEVCHLSTALIDWYELHLKG